MKHKVYRTTPDQFYLHDEHRKFVEMRAKILKVSKSEALRQIISDYILLTIKQT